ncbi:MAG: DUF3298 domain-containing protein [Candidatus Avilachnospira sp.]|jgi:hypothetical protein
MKTDEMERAKKIYEETEIPKELHGMVAELIENDREKRSGKHSESSEHKKKDQDVENIVSMKKIRRRKNYMLKRTAAAAATVIVVFTAGLNVNEAFAETAASLPVIGQLAKVLTVRSYHGGEGDFNIDMEIPAIESAGSGEISDTEFTEKINSEIEKISDEYMTQAKAEFEDYKEAFFATGGTEEEWNDRKMDIIIDYDIKYQSNPILSLELKTAKGWVAAAEERHYYNLDLSADRELKLEDVLGEDWKEICNRETDRQIREQIASDDSLSYFGYGDNGLTAEKFTSVDEDTDFYINADGKVVLVFPEYSIAPGYMGVIEFAVGDAKL